MDIVFLRDLRIETVIGIYDWEREIKQTVVLDLEMAGDVRKAAASERIEDALNYKAVAKRRLSVNKIGAVTGARDVGVLIERGTKSGVGG
jgi:dihydroneopterin aldolase